MYYSNLQTMETANIDILHSSQEPCDYKTIFTVAKESLLKKGMPLELIREVLMQLRKDIICELAENADYELNSSIPLAFAKAVNTPKRCQEMLQLIWLDINSDCSMTFWSDYNRLFKIYAFETILKNTRYSLLDFDLPTGVIWKVMYQIRNYLLCCLNVLVEKEREEVGDEKLVRVAKAIYRAGPYKEMLNLIKLRFGWETGSFGCFPEDFFTPLDPPVSSHRVVTATYCNICYFELTVDRSTYASPLCAGYMEISGKIYKLVNTGEGYP